MRVFIIILLAFSLNAQDTTLISFGSGTTDVAPVDYYDFADDVLHIKGVGMHSTVLTTNDGRMYRASSPSVSKTLASDALRLDQEICLNNVTDIQAGDLIRIYSDTDAETGWGYHENDLHYVMSVDTVNDCVKIKNPLNFNYSTSGETVAILAYRPKKLILENLTIRILNGYVLGQTPIVATGMIVEMRNVKFRNDHTTSPDGFSIAACHPVTLNNIEFTDFRYGGLMNFCRKVEAYNTIVRNSRHAYVPATWTDGLVVDGLIGVNNRGAMDAHPSFNVTYRNIDIEDNELSNCRAFGVTLDNCRIRNVTPYNQDYSYIGMTGAAQIRDEYDYLLAEYPININNTVWEMADSTGRFNGLSIYWGGEINISNTRTHSIAIHGGSLDDTKCELRLNNCAVGLIHADGAVDIVANNCHLLKSLSPGVDYALDIEGGAKKQLQNCHFTGWTGDDYLIEYLNQPSGDKPIFFNCEVPRIKDLVKTYQYTSDYEIGFLGGSLTVDEPLSPRLSLLSYFTNCDTTFNAL
jgi:hypothetical protein